MDVCDHDFHLVAQRKCVTLSDGHSYCPAAYGKVNPKMEDLSGYAHEPDMIREEHFAGRQHV